MNESINLSSESDAIPSLACWTCIPVV